MCAACLRERQNAAITHRSSGDAICVVVVLIGLMCVSGYEVGDALEHRGLRVAAHVSSSWPGIGVSHIRVHYGELTNQLETLRTAPPA